MKKIVKFMFAGVLIMTAAFSANAQNFEKGDWCLGANLSELNLNYSFLNENTSTRFKIGSAAGYFFSDKFAVEAGLGLEYTKRNDVKTSSAFTFDVAARYYPVGNLFGMIDYGGNVSGGSVSSFLGVTLGYDWFISKTVFFEPAIYYSTGLEEWGGDSLGLMLGVGVKF
jgi:outer membrane protein W